MDNWKLVSVFLMYNPFVNEVYYFSYNHWVVGTMNLFFFELIV